MVRYMDIKMILNGMKRNPIQKIQGMLKVSK